MIRTVVTTLAVAAVAGAGGWAFVDQSRHADATTIAADSGPAAPRSDRLDVAAPGLQKIADRGDTPAAHIRRAYSQVMADNATSRFMTVAMPRGQSTTVLVRVPVKH